MNPRTAWAALAVFVTLLLIFVGGCSGEVDVPDVAYDPVPELFEREILPVTAALPTAACVVPRYSPDSDPVTTDHLVIGMADGRIASFHEAGGGMVGVSSFDVSPGQAIDQVVVYRDPRAAGLGTEHVVLALHGRRVTAVSLETMSPLGALDLPEPVGAWRLHAVGGPGRKGTGSGRSRVVLSDDASVHALEPGRGSVSGLARAEVLSPGGRVVVTPLADCLAVVGRDSVWTIDQRGVLASDPKKSSGAGGAVPGPCALARSTKPDRLDFCARAVDGSWVERSVALPGSLTTATVVSDSLVLAGGATYQIPEHRIGWLKLIDARGRVLAESDHPSPVALLAEIGGFLAAQGGDRNLSVYDSTLLPLWDRASQVQPVALLPCHFNSDTSADLAVVSSRLYSLHKSDAEMLEEAIGDWVFMDRAELVPSPVPGREPRYESRLPHIAFFSGNEMKLRRVLSAFSEQSREAELDRRYGLAVATAVRARAAAAALGD
ncbi:MAG: hypothetical protein GF400_01585, partial [Candidatus Eisenbacteria bacterium]|nr:hypothetical protein [Candidatus Eisenbacteria bacterium]